MRKQLFPLVIGLGGIAVLLWLGFWQLNRLDWKEGVLAEIDARLAEPPVPLQERVLPEVDNYLSVIFEGAPTGEELWFLDSGTAAGTGHHIISAFELSDGRRIMVDLGLMGINDAAAQAAAPMTDTITVQGNLIWPDDPNDTPPVGKEWYARDIVGMSEALATEPVLVQLTAASQYDERATPLPIDTRNIKNDHLEYAITWFLLAAVWLSMTIFYMVRQTRRKDD